MKSGPVTYRVVANVICLISVSDICNQKSAIYRCSSRGSLDSNYLGKGYEPHLPIETSSHGMRLLTLQYHIFN